MSDRAKKITELTSIGTANTSIASGDLFIVEDVSANTTKSATLSTLRKAIVQGPYANDSVANTNGVALGQLYFNAAGDVKVRIV
jgi:outer membrane lipoprotein SlyB